jgi:hypothetical protein
MQAPGFFLHLAGHGLTVELQRAMPLPEED